MLKKPFLLIVLLIIYNSKPLLAQKDELDKEIARLKKEIERVEAQRKEEERETKKEIAEFEAYNQRVSQKIEAIKKQNDSLKTVLKEILYSKDSISKEIYSLGLKIKEYDLHKENLKNILLKCIKSIINQLSNLPPLLQEQYSGSLKYLYSELESGNSEVAEAFYRLTKIVGEIRTSSQEIQVVESSSPLPQLKGSIYRLRIGGIFEAIIEKEGKTAFIWNSYYKRWIEVEPAYLEALIKAVKIKEGKMVPELVELPLGELSFEKRGDK